MEQNKETKKMNEDNNLKEAVQSVAGVSVPVGAVGVAGVVGYSAVGMTTGLCVLGFGSMFVGLGVVAGLGIVAYKGAGYLVDLVTGEDDEATTN